MLALLLVIYMHAPSRALKLKLRRTQLSASHRPLDRERQLTFPAAPRLSFSAGAAIAWIWRPWTSRAQHRLNLVFHPKQILVQRRPMPSVKHSHDGRWSSPANQLDAKRTRGVLARSGARAGYHARFRALRSARIPNLAWLRGLRTAARAHG